jgi:hypothetical protein
MTKAKDGRNTLLELTRIIVDKRFQSRAKGTNREQVEDMADWLVRHKGKLFDRMTLYDLNAPDGQFYLIGGFHRYDSYTLAGFLKAPVTIFKGTFEEAMLHAARENQEHLGQPRSRDDKRHAVKMVLEVEPKMSARDIALIVGVSHTFVSEIRRELTSPEVATLPPSPETYIAIPSSATTPLSEQPEPEPVDPVDQAETGNVATLKPPEQGRTREFNWSEAAGHIGAVVKAIDRFAEIYDEKKTLTHQGLMRQMGEVEKTFEKWYRECEKAKKSRKAKS